MDNRHRFWRVILKCTGMYMLYNIVTILKKEMILQQARVIREQQVRYGGDFELSQEKQAILQQAEEYLDNHMGYRYLNRSRTEELYEQQLTKKLMEKEEALKDTAPQDLQRVQKLKSHIEQLKKAYQSVLPKMPVSWEDLKEKEEDS